MTFIFYVAKNYAKRAHKFDMFSLSRVNNQDATQSRFNYERSFVKYCVGEESKFRDFYDKLNKLD